MYDLYLSYPMTISGPLDIDAREKVREACERRLLDVYDPGTMEQTGKSIAHYRSYDLHRLLESRGMIVTWSEKAPLSKGMAAEIEWAATLPRSTLIKEGSDHRFDLFRGFWVWRPDDFAPEIHPWTRAAMDVAIKRWGGGIYTGERGLRKIMKGVADGV